MKLRAPAYPLITVDPFFSIWSTDASPSSVTTTHWTGKPNAILGSIFVDGEEYLFLGYLHGKKKLRTTLVDMDALSTSFVLENDKVRVRLRFTTPLLLDRLDIHINVPPVDFENLSGTSKAECSADIKKRVEIARQIQHKRFIGTKITCNAKMDASGIGLLRDQELREFLGNLCVFANCG